MAAVVLTIKIDGIAVDWIGEAVAGNEESANGQARFSYAPAAGVAVNTQALIGKSLVFEDAGVVAWSGYVAEAQPSLQDFAIAVVGTTGLKKYINTLTEVQLQALLPDAKWHRRVYGDTQTRWEQCQEMLDSVTQEIHMDRMGAVQVGDWDPVGSSTDTQIVYGSPQVQLAPLDTLINRVSVTVEVRFTRLKQRHYHWQWDWNNTVLNWLAAPTTLPSRSMIEEAAYGCGWPPIYGVRMQTLPDAAATDELQQIVAVTAWWDGFTRWTQPVSQRYALTVESTESIDDYGVNVDAETASFEVVAETADWQNSQRAYTPLWPRDNLLDYYLDLDDTADRDAVIELMLARASRRIWDAHRQNIVQYAVPIYPTIDLSEARTITRPQVSATGKAFAYEHRWSAERENTHAYTVISLAVLRGGAPTTGGTLTPPVAPSTAPIHAAPSIGEILPTRIGNTDTAQDWDVDWLGYTGLYETAQGSPTPAQSSDWDDRFKVQTPILETEVTDELVATASQTYDIDVPDNMLSITPVLP